MWSVEDNELKNKILEGLKTERRISSKLHVTEIICCTRKTIMKRHGIKEIVTEGSILAMAQGRGDHAVIEELFPISEKRIEYEDIVGSLDAVGERIVEIYTTIYSSNNSIQNMIDKSAYFHIKMRQIMTYCMINREKQADLIILFRFGDYKDRKPQLKVFRLSFFDNTMNNNWNLVLRNKETIQKWDGKEIDLSNLPPASPIEKECDYCGFSNICFPSKDISFEESREIDFTTNKKEEVF